MKIGVLTGMGEMYLIDAPKMGVVADEDLAEIISEIIEENSGNFNWQVLTEKHDGTLNFRIINTDRSG